MQDYYRMVSLTCVDNSVIVIIDIKVVSEPVVIVVPCPARSAQEQEQGQEQGGQGAAHPG